MSPLFQNLIVAAIVIAAAAFLARSLWQTFAQRSGCGSCGGGCKSNARPDDIAGQALVQIGELPSRQSSEVKL